MSLSFTITIALNSGHTNRSKGTAQLPPPDVRWHPLDFVVQEVVSLAIAGHYTEPDAVTQKPVDAEHERVNLECVNNPQERDRWLACYNYDRTVENWAGETTGTIYRDKLVAGTFTARWSA